MSRRRSFATRRYHYKRSCLLSWEVAGSTATSNAWTFKLDQVTNYTEFTALYDQYRINRIVARWVPRTTDSGQGAGERGNFYSVIDYDDSATINVVEAQESQNVKRTVTTRSHIRSFVPAVLAPTYRVGVTSAYGPKFKQWVDCAYPDVPHYGIKAAVQNWDNLGITYDLIVTFYMSFRNVR